MPFVKGYTPHNKLSVKVCSRCGIPIEPTPRQLRKGEYLCPTHKQADAQRRPSYKPILSRLKANGPKWRKNPNNKVKQAAQLAANRAVKDGTLIKPNTCQRCGAAGRIEMHHADYAKPLEVQFLCKSCHGKADYAMRSLEVPDAR
jgi:formylmethanofuran dehydrogenase subunit E